MEHWIPVIYWNQTRGSILQVIQPKEWGVGENGTKRYNCGETFSFLRYKIYILQNNSCSKIYYVKKNFVSVVQYKIMFLFHITVT
jgi:hypothetical protein